jgi:RNA polymerase sigma factor (sigma-70 family)
VQRALTAVSETSLVTLAVAGDREAFGELVARREAWLRDLLRRLCGHKEQADELAQEAFLQAWRNLAGLRAPAAFAGWLRRIAVTLWLQEARRGQVPLTELLEEHLQTLPEPADVLSGAITRMDLDNALMQLRAEERLCVVLAHAEGMSHGEIASATGMPLGTVKSHVTRGSAKLRVLLA